MRFHRKLGPPPMSPPPAPSPAARPRRALKKYEACAGIVEMRRHVEQLRDDSRDYLAKAETDPDDSNREGMVRYYAEKVEIYQRWLDCLDMAGAALTR